VIKKRKRQRRVKYREKIIRVTDDIEERREKERIQIEERGRQEKQSVGGVIRSNEE
jgi:hypothetical protein